jgi:hypothetical protein
VDLTSPDAEMRRGILRQLAAEHDVPLQPALLDALALLPIENLRELEGAFGRILAAVQVQETPVRAADLGALLGLDREWEGAEGDEFGTFLTDISSAVAAVVETAPWRRTLADAILRWGGEGVRTRRLEAALDADSAPDIDALLADFGRDVIRLREIERELPTPPDDPQLLRDPDRLAEAEALLARTLRPPPPAPPAPPLEPQPVADPWFLDRDKLAWQWVDVEGRALESRG